MPKVSIIICSFKAPASLRDCLESIACQTTLSGGGVEVLLINNGFSEGMEESFRQQFAGSPIQFSIVREPVPGQGHARIRGFNSASGEWFVLLDDDNTIEADFIENLFGIIEANRNLGGITPAVSPAWERPPPAWLEGFGTLCLSYNQPLPLSNPLWESCFPASGFNEAPRPPGGGMVIHRKVVDAYLAAPNHSFRVSLSRTGSSLVGCEDEDLWSCIKPTGMDLMASNKLRVHHHIPASRLKMAYLLRLNYQMQYSYRLLHRLNSTQANGGDRQTPYDAVNGILQTLLLTCKLLKIGALYPRKNPMQKQLLLAAREWGTLAGNFATLPSHANGGDRR